MIWAICFQFDPLHIFLSYFFFKFTFSFSWMLPVSCLLCRKGIYIIAFKIFNSTGITLNSIGFWDKEGNKSFLCKTKPRLVNYFSGRSLVHRKYIQNNAWQNLYHARTPYSNMNPKYSEIRIFMCKSVPKRCS